MFISNCNISQSINQSGNNAHNLFKIETGKVTFVSYLRASNNCVWERDRASPQLIT